MQLRFSHRRATKLTEVLIVLIVCLISLVAGGFLKFKAGVEGSVGFVKYKDPKETTAVKFFYDELLRGSFKSIHLTKDPKACLNIPVNHKYQKPSSVFALDCIIVYQHDFCQGKGLRISGAVPELRSLGVYSGISSVSHCDSDIRISFRG